MTFDSIIFALFLPIVFAAYWFFSDHSRRQNLVLLSASYVFYGWWNWRMLSLIIITTCSSYLSARAVYHCLKKGDRQGAWWCNVANCVLNLGILGAFKYYNFFADSFNSILHSFGMQGGWPLLHLILPVGISFYTFQALSYTIDVYRGQVSAERSLLNYATYLAFFPQLVAGPIERASKLLPQFAATRSFVRADAVEGCRLMLWGFAKKIVIADNCAMVVEQVFGNLQTAGGSALLYASVLFAFQIYADFSGYSDIAIGTARLFGIRLSVNFDRPYFATSIPDFWRRWHISLTSWFRDYVYIPLGGSRKGVWRTFLNTLFVFSLSGLWHGANWTFVVWGAYHGLLFFPWCMGWMRRKKGSDERSFMRQLPSIFVTFMLVCIGWIIFRADSLADAWTCIHGIMTRPDLSMLHYSKSIVLFIAFMMAAEWWNLALPRKRWQRWIIYYLLIGVMLLKATSSTQFIYFQF